MTKDEKEIIFRAAVLPLICPEEFTKNRAPTLTHIAIMKALMKSLGIYEDFQKWNPLE